VHQGVVLHCSALRPALANYMERMEPQQREGRAPLWVALDEVWDPHVHASSPLCPHSSILIVARVLQNFGAIVRSAMFFGARGIILRYSAAQLFIWWFASAESVLTHPYVRAPQ
jgi:tRNA G18 (ribose-2'-O)-methylase SpoU